MAASLSSLCLNDTRRGQPERLSTSQRGGDQCHTATIDGGSGGPLSWTRSMDPRWRKVTGGIWEFAKTLIIAFILAQLVMVSVAQAFQVEQYSMEPTLLPHDRVLVNKFLYRFRAPERGDIIVLRYPRDPGRNYIKRIIGLPGDRVHLQDGRLLINGVPVEEVYINGMATGD